MKIKSTLLKMFTGTHSKTAQIDLSSHNVFIQADKLNSQQTIKLDQEAMLFDWAGML